MLIKVTLFITLLMYAFIVGQSFFYILALSNATKKMQAIAYIETRKLIDAELQSKLSLVYYAALGASVLLTAFSVVNPNGILFISSVIALIALVIDVVFALKGNVPLNKTINSWSETQYPDNWQQVRSKWFSIYHIRQVVNIVGFVSLLAGLVFGL
ncbi:MAG TPA: hypothetical protein VF487_00170 [Chitinophagaceae bacterium]